MSCYNSLLLEAEPGTSHASILLAGGGICSWCPTARSHWEMGFTTLCPAMSTSCLVFAVIREKNLCFWWIILIHFRHVPLDEMHDCVEDKQISFCLSNGKFVVLKLMVLWWRYPSTIRHHCKDEWHLCAHSHIVPSVRLVFPIYEADSSEHWYHFAGVLVPFCCLLLFQQLQALWRCVVGFSSVFFLKSLLPLDYSKQITAWK